MTAGPGVLTLSPPAVVRRWKTTPLTVLGVTNTEACNPPAPVYGARTINPALVHWLMFSTVFTRAIASKSPFILVPAQWNSSAVPQMSEPAPLTVNVLPAYVADPIAPTLPISASRHPSGNARLGPETMRKR